MELAEKLKTRGSEPGKIPKVVLNSRASEIEHSVPRYKTLIE